MPRTKSSPKRLDVGARQAIETEARDVAPPKTLQQMRAEKNEMLAEMLANANAQMATTPKKSPKGGGGGSRKSGVKISKKPLKIASLTKRRNSLKRKSPKPVQCPAGCVPAPPKTTGQKLEAQRLQSLVERAAQLDKDMAEEVDLDADPSPPATQPVKKDSSQVARLNAARQQAIRENRNSFVFEGDTYVMHERSNGKHEWKRVGGTSSRPTGPCVAFRNDPIGCDAQPNCSYAKGAKRSYCSERHTNKPKPATVAATSFNLPIATATPIEYAPFGIPTVMATELPVEPAITAKPKPLPKLKPVGA